MEKRALLAFALTFVVIALWGRFMVPQKEVLPLPDPPLAEETTGNPATLRESTALPSPEPESPSESDSVPVTRAQNPQDVFLNTGRYRITLSNRGAVVTSWVLKDYTDEYDQQLEIVSPSTRRLDRYPLSVRLEDPDLDERINTALYEVDRKTVTSADGPAERIHFRFRDDQGLVVEKTFEFPRDGFISRVQIRVQGPAGIGQPAIQVGPGFASPDAPKGASRFFVLGQAILFNGSKLKKIPPKQLDPGEVLPSPGDFQWAGLEDTYFASVLIPSTGHIMDAWVRSDRWVEDGIERKLLSLGLPLASGGGDFDLFVGPKDLEILSGLGSDLDRMVDFRPRDPFGILPTIARLLLSALKFIHRGVGNYGWAIILLTITIRVLFFPLTQRSSVSMRRTQQKMKKIQPRIQSIKDKFRKHRKDPQWRNKMNQEVMELYKKEGVNPLASMSGCLPMLLQLPILFGFYSLLQVAIELRQAPFIFWIVDLSRKDPYYITPIVMGVTMFLQQKMTTPVGMDPMQRRMMMMMPLMFTFFFVNFPSGLVLYWLVSNLFGIGQQFLINRQADRLVNHEIGARNGKLQRVSR